MRATGTFYGDIAAGKLLDIAKSYDPDANAGRQNL
jgi:hypothetical protein